jgi:predicted nucleic acid-binding protein
VRSRSAWPPGATTAAGVNDLLTAAVAEHHGAVVPHYDADFEHIAVSTGQPHAWIVPRGSID